MTTEESSIGFRLGTAIYGGLLTCRCDNVHGFGGVVEQLNKAQGETGIVERALAVLEGVSPAAKSAGPDLVALAGAGRAGDLVSLALDGSGLGPQPGRLVATDLVSDTGHRMSASNLSFWPGEIRWLIPSGTPAGLYSGLIQAIGRPDRALVSLNVV
jgi:hypothetical protein